MRKLNFETKEYNNTLMGFLLSNLRHFTIINKIDKPINLETLIFYTKTEATVEIQHRLKIYFINKKLTIEIKNERKKVDFNYSIETLKDIIDINTHLYVYFAQVYKKEVN